MNSIILKKALTANQKNRFLLIYPYLRKILNSLRSKRFSNINKFDWDDICGQVYHDIYILCTSNKWLKYSVPQVKRFLYTVCFNCAFNVITKNQRIEEKETKIDIELISDKEIKELSFFDQIEINTIVVEKKLNNRYIGLLGDEILNNEEYRTVIKRYARIITEKNIAREAFRGKTNSKTSC